MTNDGGDQGSRDDADSLLRAMAATPEGPPEATPKRVAHFRIVGRLGEGGMGQVYRAEDETLRRTVALKLLPDATGNEEKRQRFLREARSAAAISHPNVAVVYQVGEADGRIYIAMELVEGENLRERLLRGRLDVATAKELAGQIARGLAAAHDKGIVHRDLKPENVMITPSGVVKLLDFGLAKSGVEPLSGKTEAALAKTETLVTSGEGRIMGTPEYMSPEQAMGEPLDVRSDVFSFGILLYEMLSGTRPFTGASTGHVLVAIARDAAPPLRERAPDVDEATEAVVMRCLAKASGERFANAGEILVALGGPTSEKATTMSQTEVVPVSTSPAIARKGRLPRMTVGALAAGVLVAGTVVAWRWHDRTARGAVASSSSASSTALPTAPVPTVVTDYPPPKTSSPEAAAEFAAAMQALRDDAEGRRRAHLDRAVELDPRFAAAHLWTAYRASTQVARDHVAAATEYRSDLTARDAAILEAVRLVVDDRPDLEEASQRWKALADAYPGDALLAMGAGQALLDANHVNDGLAQLDRALTLDPTFAWPYAVRANFQVRYGGDFEGAVRSATAGLEISPSSDGCLAWRAEAESRLGRCDELEEDARRAIALAPNAELGWDRLENALVARAAPIDSIAEADRRWIEALPEPRKREARAEDPLELATLYGDFATAIALIPEADRFMATATSDYDLDGVRSELLIFTEAHMPDRAVAVAEAYLKRYPALTPATSAWSPRYRALRVLNEAGRISKAELRARREQWAQEAMIRLPARSKNKVWLTFYAGTSVTPDDAREALDALPRYSPLPPLVEASDEEMLGHTLMLAGRVDEAIPHFRSAVTPCVEFSILWWHLLAAEDLGEALESKGDKTGACAAYADVLSRWGHARPRSVTADKARSHATKLGCAP